MQDHLPEYLSKEEASALMSNIPDCEVGDRLVIGMMLKMGMRASEPRSIRKAWVHIGDGTLRIRGKGSKDRVLVIPDEMLEELAKYIEPYQDMEQPFKDYNRKAIYYRVKKYGRMACLREDIHPHMLRHTFAVWSLKSGRDIRTVQKLLGHKSLETTAVYLRLLEEEMKRTCREFPLPF